jgi:hypothetical protein
MYAPTKKSLYILIACVLSLTVISFAKNKTDKPFGLLAVDKSATSSPKTITNEYFDFMAVTPGQGLITSNDNITENFSRELFSKFSAINNGNDVTQVEADNLVNEAITAYKDASLGKIAHFKYSDVIIAKSNNENLKSFANSFASRDKICTAEIKKIAESTKDPLQTGNLYKSCAEEYAKIPVVVEISQAYLSLLNTNYSLGEKITELKDGDSDPIKALVVVKEMSAIDSERTASYKYISNFIKSSGIIFSNTDDGKLWLGTTK